MRRLFAVAACGVALVAWAAPGASAKPGAGQGATQPGTIVWDNSMLKPGAASAPFASPPAAIPPALTGYIAVSNDNIPNPTGEQSLGSVSCPAGTVAFGGGVDGHSSSVFQSVNGSIPIVSGGLAVGWRGWEDNTSGVDSTFAVWALCAKKRKQYAVVSQDIYIPGNTQQGTLVNCPLNAKGKRMKVLGGGGVGSALSPGMDLNSSYPQGGKLRTWRIFINNTFPGELLVTNYAVCGSAKGWVVVQGAAVDNPPGQQSGIHTSCPAGLVVVGGGVYATSTSLQVNINSTFPFASATAWSVSENNASTSDETFTPSVVCVA
jgi:hypothetical protein